MKLYLAMEYSDRLMEGTYEELIGVFSSTELAGLALTDRTWFKDATMTAPCAWEYVFDGELTKRWKIIQAKLDQKLLG